MDEELKEMAEVFRAHYCGNGLGRICIGVCAVCGWMKWRSAEEARPTETVLDRFSPNEERCVKCDEIRSRYPEVFDWVAGVVVMRLLADQEA